jgi:RNA-directed DNA polymerase
MSIYCGRRTPLLAVQEGMRRRRHMTIEEQGDWLRQVMSGFFAYHAVPTNYEALAAFRDHVIRLWRRTGANGCT